MARKSKKTDDDSIDTTAEETYAESGLQYTNPSR